MTLDSFNALTEEEKTKILEAYAAQETLLKDNEAQIASLTKENETFKAGSEKLEKELKETKELNFTLARKVDTNIPRPSFEDTLHDIFGVKERSQK